MLSASFLLIIPIMRFILSTFAILLFLSTSINAADEEENPNAEAPAASTTPPAPLIPRTEPDIDSNRITELLKNKDPDTEILQLDTGKEGEKLIAFYRAEGSGIKQGGILMFPDQSTHMDWPENINYLRKGLSDYGWYTLSIYLPQPTKNKLPKRTLPVLSAIKASPPNEDAVNESSEEGEPEANTPDDTASQETEQPIAETPKTDNSGPEEAEKEPTEPYKEKMDRLGKTALKHMSTTDDLTRFIVMGIGTGATWAAQYVQVNEETQDLRLVMINAKNPQENDTPNLLTLLPEISSTIIDLHHGNRIENTDLMPESPDRRLRLARQKRMNNFHQSRMPALSDNWKRNNSWLLKHTRGMINTYIIKAEQEQRSLQIDSSKTPDTEKAPG